MVPNKMTMTIDTTGSILKGILNIKTLQPIKLAPFVILTVLKIISWKRILRALNTAKKSSQST